ncbi:MAG: metalloregulator ArsR/SmtB family transcription factor [Planctomycetota bacterium]
MNDQQLDLTFGALADSTRRGMLVQLSAGEANVSTLAAPYDMSQPAVSKHLRVLERAGLIERRRSGREQIIRVKPEAARTATDWLAHYTQFWSGQFDAVESYVQQKTSRRKGKTK